MRWPIQSASHCRRISSVSPGLPRDAVENREFIGHTSMAPLDGNEEHASLKSKKRRAQYCTVLITVPPSEVIRSVHAIRGDTRRPTLPYCEDGGQITASRTGEEDPSASDLHPSGRQAWAHGKSPASAGRAGEDRPADHGTRPEIVVVSSSSPPRLCHGGNGSDSLAFSKGVRRR